MGSWVALALALAVQRTDHPAVLVVVGAPGSAEYGAEFGRWADLWKAAAGKGGVPFAAVGRDPEAKATDRDRLQSFLKSQRPTGTAPLWVVLVGHGTDDGREARFNLRGPDLTAKDLAAWLGPFTRPVAVINCASASGPFLPALSGPNRVVVTSTRSGHESNYARFGQYLSEAIGDAAADLDRDGQVSLLEVYLTASARTAEWYKREARLATEHPLLDDTGDKLGSPPDWFRGVRAVKRAKDDAPVDGTRAHQWHLVPSERERAIPAAVRAKRDALERDLAALRDRKGSMGEDEYYRRVEAIAVDLARLYRDLPAR